MRVQLERKLRNPFIFHNVSTALLCCISRLEIASYVESRYFDMSYGYMTKKKKNWDVSCDTQAVQRF